MWRTLKKFGLKGVAPTLLAMGDMPASTGTPLGPLMDSPPLPPFAAKP